MVCLDKLKLSIPLDKSILLELNEAKFENKYSYGYRAGEKYLTMSRLELKPQAIKSVNAIGLQDLNIDTLNGYINLTFSGKVMREKYFEGININTIEEALHNINEYGFIKLNIPNTIEKANVHLCDEKNDLKVINPVEDYISTLNWLTMKNNIGSNFRKQSIDFYPKSKYNNNRLLFYNKNKDLTKEYKSGKQGIARLLGFDKIHSMDQTLRVERNVRSHKEIRNSYQVKDIGLLGILNSKENVNLNYFKKIQKAGAVETDLFAKQKEMSLKDIIFERGANDILKECDNDIQKVEDWINKSAGNNYYMKQRFLHLHQNNAKGRLIKEIEEKLKGS